MFSKLPMTSAAAAIAFSVALAAAPAEAKDWLRAMERHDSAAEAAKYEPKSDNPQWDFHLGTVVNDMNWRARTASMLRKAPRPGASVRTTAPHQLADRPEPRRLQYRFRLRSPAGLQRPLAPRRRVAEPLGVGQQGL